LVVTTKFCGHIKTHHLEESVLIEILMSGLLLQFWWSI